MKRKAAALTTALALTATMIPAGFGTLSASAVASTKYNYGEALQKSMFFYQVQQSGPLADWNQVSWRADSMMNDYVLGGWFDAGDHIKFALTNAYSAVMLAWGILEFDEGVEEIGIADLYRDNLQYSLDFLVGCDLGDEVVYQIGDIGFDHKWWGSAEVYLDKLLLMEGTAERPYYTTTDSNVTGEMAAALAAGYLVFKDVDPTLADTYLEHAKNCFRIADETRADGNTPASDAMYPSSHFYDELFWAANWLYMATGDQSYLDLCESDYIANLGLESQSTELKYTWGHCWDDVQQGGTFLYAINTGDPEWIAQAEKHLAYWMTGYGGKSLTYTPDGLPWLFNWGSLRHATTTAFLAYVGAKHFCDGDTTQAQDYIDFADGIMNYAFGDNDLGMSYVVGMGDKYPQAWHHRTSSGAWNDKWSNIGQTEGDDAKPHAHILYGALVGGPDQQGNYVDEIAQYQYTEVAIDYNAGYTAALCAMVQMYGGTIDESFPPVEEPKWTEFFMRASINQASSTYTEIKAFAMNHSAWPARTIEKLSYRYFFDISEVLEAGYTVDDITVKIGYDQHSADEGVMSISNPIQYDGTVYYVELTFADGTVVMPTGQSEHRSECQFRIAVPDNAQGVWDASNDYSFQGLTQGGEDAMVDTPYICMYDNGVLIWGTEPDGTTPDDVVVPGTTTTTEDGSSTATMLGDVDCNKELTIADAVLLNRFLAEDKAVSLTDEGKANADCNGIAGITTADAAAILQVLSSIISFDDLSAPK